MTPLSRTVLLAVGAVAVTGGALVGGAFAATGDTVPRGVHVAGTDLTGSDRAEARRRVERAVAPLLARPVTVTADDARHDLPPAASGLSIDVEAMVDEAVAGGPVDRVRGLFGARRELEPEGQVDEAALRRALTAFQQQVDRPPREGAVRFQGVTPVAVLPQPGRRLDLDAAVEQVGEEWLEADGPLELEHEVTPVKSTAEGVQAVVLGFARPAVAAPVAVDTGNGTLQVRPADIAASLVFRMDEEGQLAPDLRGDALRKALGARAQAVERPPRNARIRIRDGAPEVVPAQDGLRLDPARLSAAVGPVLRASAPRRARVGLVPVQPDLTTQEAEALGVREVIGSFTTRYPCCRPRVTNIRRIAELVDGALVLPGQTFSLNGHVGRRTRAKGFVDAPQILDGEFVDDVGGGVSQFATTMFNAAFFAGLEDVEHKPHSYYITRYPEGREATVFYPEVDLKWRNDSGKGVLVTTSSTGTSVTVTLWGTKRYEVEALKSQRSRIRPFERRYVQRDDCTPAEGQEGFDVTVTRVFKQGGREVKRERFFTRYLPEPNFVCGPPPSGASAG